MHKLTVLGMLESVTYLLHKVIEKRHDAELTTEEAHRLSMAQNEIYEIMYLMENEPKIRPVVVCAFCEKPYNHMSDLNIYVEACRCIPPQQKEI